MQDLAMIHIDVDLKIMLLQETKGENNTLLLFLPRLRSNRLLHSLQSEQYEQICWFLWFASPYF